jgi:hypothetical protein
MMNAIFGTKFYQHELGRPGPTGVLFVAACVGIHWSGFARMARSKSSLMVKQFSCNSTIRMGDWRIDSGHSTHFAPG